MTVALRAVEELQSLNKDLWSRVSQDGSIPQTVKTMIYMHVTAPWIPNFVGYIITPLHDGLDGFLGKPVVEYGPSTWYQPSMAWWMAHAERSHPPKGEGCDAGVHSSFLTAEGENAEFGYAAMLKDGTVLVLGPEDFDVECAFWASGIEG